MTVVTVHNQIVRRLSGETKHRQHRKSSGRDRVINIIIIIVVVEITAAQPSPSDRQSLCVRKDGSKVDGTADPPAYPTPLRRSGSCSRGKGLGVLLVVDWFGMGLALLPLRHSFSLRMDTRFTQMFRGIIHRKVTKYNSPQLELPAEHARFK